MRRQRLVAARDRDAALAAARQAEAQIAVAGGNSRQSTAEARARILADLAKAESEARLRKEELTKAVKRSSLQRPVSPVDGPVKQQRSAGRSVRERTGSTGRTGWAPEQ